MTTREDVSNFKFFACTALNDGGNQADDYQDVDLNGAVSMPEIDTQGYETVTFGWMHGSTISTGGVPLAVHLRMQHASNSIDGRDTRGSWSDCEAGDVYGQDFYRLISTLTMDSWLALDALTREKYLYSIPPDVTSFTKCVSGCFTMIGISITSQASCKTDSFMPTVAYMGKQRWVRLVASLSVASAAGAGSFLAAFFCVLGRPGQWPVSFAEVV